MNATNFVSKNQKLPGQSLIAFKPRSSGTTILSASTSFRQPRFLEGDFFVSSHGTEFFLISSCFSKWHWSDERVGKSRSQALHRKKCLLSRSVSRWKTSEQTC